ncbi:MAG: class I SAM-dependent methyltransferase [Eubacteriales bacterium]|nr:class I SAM-dependent methyltransferase [Eubacteriales bacterium]
MLNDKIKDYWEGEAAGYSEGVKNELQGKTRNEWKKLVLDNAPVEGSMEILDIGTGPGFFPIVLGEEGHHVTGIDITENMIKEAKENVAAAGQTADLMTMDCHELKFADNTFDMVICRNLTWTIDDPQKAYKEWLRVLKPGGRLLVFDACWYLHFFDEEQKKIYWAHDDAMKAKYGRGIHNHADQDAGYDLSGKLFMSNKQRPTWDLNYMLEIGFSKVFATKDISDLVRSEMDRELNKLTPQFMVGGEK